MRYLLVTLGDHSIRGCVHMWKWTVSGICDKLICVPDCPMVNIFNPCISLIIDPNFNSLLMPRPEPELKLISGDRWMALCLVMSDVEKEHRCAFRNTRKWSKLHFNLHTARNLLRGQLYEENIRLNTEVTGTLK